MKASENMKKWMVFGMVAAACTLGAVGLYAMKPEEKTEPQKVIPLKPVTVQQVTPGDYPARIRAFGEVHARWTTSLRAQVGGRIIRINEHLQPGVRLRAGEMILELDRTDYQTALAQARLELENARVHLIQEERQASQARSDWKGSGIAQAPVSPLVFHEPQLKAATARLAYARQAVKKAENDLGRTRITAPYTGRVTQRFADKGETLFAGDQVATLISTGDVEVRVSLDSAQAGRLGPLQGTQVRLLDPATGRSWPGKLVRDGGRMNRKTRLHPFFIEPSAPEGDLLPGMFVTAAIQGKTRPDLLALPESALTRDGEFWVVDSQDRLRRLPARVAFYDNGKVYVEHRRDETSLRVVMTPAPGFIAGTRVAPKLLGES